MLQRARDVWRAWWRGDRRAFLLRMLPGGSTCAEIGVWKGEFARQIVEATRPAELHLIDPWLFRPDFPTRLYGGREAKSQADMDEIHARVVQAFANEPNVHIHRKASEDAAAAFPDGYFDWVYIDADHSYEGIRRDLESYRPKVKRNGLITGDDYRRDVKRAVEELVASGRAAFVKVRRSQFILRRL